MRRRSDYVRACIVDLSPPAGIEENETNDLQETNPVVLLARKEGVAREQVWPHVLRLLSLYRGRWPDNEEKAVRNVHRILANAISKTHPLKYINKVLQNERQANKQRSRKPKKPRGAE